MNTVIHWHDRLESTNALLKAWVERDAHVPTGTVVAAREQTRGRGRMGRAWVSGARENLAASLWVRGAFDLKRSPSSGMAVALAVADFLRKEGLNPTLKWPNDVQVNRKKICGILSERLPFGLVIGIGLNVNLQATGQIDQPATSLRIETGREWSVDDVAVRIVDQAGYRLGLWIRGGFEAIRKDWEKRIPDLGAPVSVRDGNRIRRGTLAGFGEDGELLLRNPDGTVVSVWAGEVSREAP